MTLRLLNTVFLLILGICYQFTLSLALKNNLTSRKLSQLSYLKNAENKIDQTVSVFDLLTTLKNEGKVQKWSSAVSFVRGMTSTELLQLTRLSFTANNYFEDLMKSMKEDNDNTLSFYVLSSTIIIIFGLILFPMFTAPTSVKNTVGLISILYPFIFGFINIIAPGISFNVYKTMINSRKDRYEIEENIDRIVYHEAGHILVGYLTGITINSYIINDDLLSHAAVDINPKYFQATLNDQNSSDKAQRLPTITVGNLLVVALAGVVAETLRCGNCKGGKQDLLVAKSLLDIVKASSLEKESYLRWAVGKSLSLLRTNRNALDDLADAMRKGESVYECYMIIEKATD